jgi:hypothetical protein
VVRTEAAADAAGDDQRRAVPRGSRPRDGNPATGTAVPRSGDWRGSGGGRRGGTVYVPRGRTYNYGGFYGGFPYYGAGYYGYGYGGYGGYPYSRYGSGYEFGELRLQVEPRHAEVYVDGYFAGHVDDFDGVFQSLTLEDGGHKIEIVAPGFETLEVDIRILPGRKVTYRGVLRPRP